jgi:hypothetical protein
VEVAKEQLLALTTVLNHATKTLEDGL